MPFYVYLATAIGVFIVTQTNGKWDVVRHTLTGQSLTSIAVSKDTILAGTTDGLWRSTDNGQTWQKADKDLLVTAATGGGLYHSKDGGKLWQNAYPSYVRAVWVDPEDPRHMIAGPADGVSRNGRIEESYDGGTSWHAASEGMKVPWPRHMVERFLQYGNELFATLSNGEIWSRPLDEPQWQQVLPEIDSVKAIAARQR
jgi:hypothetical protein